MPSVIARRCVSCFVLCCLLFASAGLADEPERKDAYRGYQVGTFAIDISPTNYPVIVNGMFDERVADRTADRLFARAFVVGDGTTRLAIVVVDSLMLPRELLDDVKKRAAELTGIPVDRMLISATHTHSAPSAMGCLGSRTDPEYPAFLVPQLVRAIELANDRLQPAHIGWTKFRAPGHTFCRRYIRRPDRLLDDPFGQPTVRAHMHPGYQSPDIVGPSGPVDDEVSLVAMQGEDGKLLGVLANFSMHYIGSPLVSSDYFGRFAAHLASQLDGGDGTSGCIVAMSQGTSGDLMGMNYSAPASELHYDRYAKELATMAAEALRDIEYHRSGPLSACESKLVLRRRVPDAKRLAWAKTLGATIGERRPRGYAEIYALEQILLDEEPQRELKLQAIRIGDVGIAAIPNEVFGITGIKLKRQSPLPFTFNIELANGAEGYIPPPEQHKLGGYTTWPARTAGLEVDAEPKIVEALLGLLEEVSGAPRKSLADALGPYGEAVLKSKPRAYWQLGEIAGDVARDSSDHQTDATYEDGIARYLTGPVGDGFGTVPLANRAPHLAGGRVRANVRDVGDTYSVEFWFWNGLPTNIRPVTGYLFSRGPGNDDQAPGDHLALGGLSAATGRLLFFNGNALNQIVEGRTAIEPRRWNHVVFVRDGEQVRVFLNGSDEPEIVGTAGLEPRAIGDEWYFGGRSDNFSNFEGKIDEIAVYDYAMSGAEAARHFEAAGIGGDAK